MAEVIGEVMTWQWVKASVATKLLHKKRPRLIPILDNRAILEAYLEPAWPEKHTWGETVGDPARVREAVDQIAFDPTRPENEATWAELEAMESERTRVELFDMIWWRYFRRLEPR